MDGPFYVDSRAPHISADATAVTIIGTNKAIVPIANLPILGANYFNYIGKACRISMFGRMSTAAAAGTMTFSLMWGTGADANGTNIGASAAIVPTNSLVNCSWMWQTIIRCRALGATGSLLVTGEFRLLNSVTSTAAASDYMIPATAPAPVTVDLTAANVISPQVLATTSTTNTMQVHDYLFESLN